MAVSSQSVNRAQCDGCPHTNYADAPALPVGFHLTVNRVDGNGVSTEVVVYACQPGHIGAAVKKVLQSTAAGTRLGQSAVDKNPTSPVTRPQVVPTATTPKVDVERRGA